VSLDQDRGDAPHQPPRFPVKAELGKALTGLTKSLLPYKMADPEELQLPEPINVILRQRVAYPSFFQSKSRFVGMADS
jgi:hypothetical protein